MTTQVKRTEKMMMDTSWKMIPATMMRVPVVVFPGGFFAYAPAAKAPPIACTTREMRSAVQKM